MEFKLNQYLILGHRYRYDRFQQEYLANPNSQNDALLYIDNPFDTTITSHNDISVVLDNNAGRFVYIGKIYIKSVGDFIDIKITFNYNLLLDNQNFLSTYMPMLHQHELVIH